MGLGELLTGADDWIDQQITKLPLVGDNYATYLKQDQARMAAQKDQHPSFWKGVTDASNQDVAGLMSIAGGVPGFDQLMTALDVGRRSWDTLLITSQHAGAKSAAAGGSDNVAWGELLNKDNWAKAWAESSYDNADRVTGGQILSARAFGANDQIEQDPFAAADAQSIQDNAQGTWYGRTSASLIDLGASFIAPPGSGLAVKGAKAAREAKTVSSAAEAELAAQRLADVGVEGVAAGKVTATQKAKDAFDIMAPGRDQNIDSVLHRQMVGLRDLDGMTDPSEILSTLRTRMDVAGDGDLANIADVMSEINRVPDATMRDKLRMNYFLSAHGSATARKAFIEDAPLIARNFENLTSTPREAAALSYLYAARIEDSTLPVDKVIEDFYGTAADKAEEAALRDSLEAKIAEAKDAKALWDETRAAKPTIKNLDAQLLQRSRNDADANVRRLKDELDKARKNLDGTKRWAGASVKKGEVSDVADFHTALGDARARVTELQTQLAQARSDRQLLHDTPLPGREELAAWREDMGAAKDLTREAKVGADWEQAFLRTHQATQKAKQAEITRLRPTLNRANSVLNDIFDVAGDAPSVTITGGAEPTLLAALKKNVRDRIGAEHYVFHGEGNTIMRVRSLPNRAARMALAPQARGSISLTEPSLGMNQLGDALARSGAFTPEEIVHAKNTLIRAKGHARAGVVASYQTKMLQRMAVDFFAKKGYNLAPEDALRRAKEITDLAEKHWGAGNAWVSRKADEQVSNKLVTLKDENGTITAFDQPMLRSHLADNAPLLDPRDFKLALEKFEPTLRQNVQLKLHSAANLHDAALQFWKVGALLRPGLMVRAMLDTGPRMLASLTAAESLMASMSGAANLVHNKALTGLAKIHFAGLSPDEAAAKARYLGLKPVQVKTAGGKVTHQFASDVADLQTKLEAASKGQTVHGALFHDMTKSYDGLKVDRTKWARRKADSPLWHVAYKEYAGMLLASPTARKLADMMAVKHTGESIDDIRRSIKNSPEFLAEFNKFAQPMGRSREQFLDHVMHEVELMFPSQRLLNAAKNGGLTEKLIKQEVPGFARFDIPSPELSAFQGIDAWNRLQAGADKAFRVLLDKPDMWLARNPVAVQLYNRAVKQEYADLARRFGPDHEVTPEMMRSIDHRARGHAIGYVRRTFFDTTRSTGAHHYAARLSPFFAAWEDAMMSWGRLIFDDPRRLVKLSAAYHAPFTVASSSGLPLVVNQDGQPIGRGDKADGVFIRIPTGVKGVKDYRVRIDSLNSIFQGETWWLPGVGPTVQVPVTAALANDKLVSREAALDLINTDNWLGQQVLKSMYLGGELPPADAKSLGMSTLPGWLRNLATETLGTGKIRNRQTTFNYLVAEAMANGQPLNSETYTKLWEQANKSANAAAVIRLVAGGGFGMTGTAAVDGQFYADQFHIIQAMTPEMRDGLSADEYFSQKFPEAADLDWSITKNETGIVASVNASKAESRLGGLLQQAKASGAGDIGWMILGRDNMVDTEFSRTAYNLQRSAGNRTYQSSEEAQAEAQAAVGWRQYQTWNQQVLDMLKDYGLDENSDQYIAAKRAVADYLKQTNPAWAKAFSQRTDRFGYFYSQAQRLASSKQLSGRSDMVAFRDYDKARQQVMDQFGIASLKGTSEKYVAARAVMRQAGETLAKRDLGFQQMWDRFLSGEVEEG